MSRYFTLITAMLISSIVGCNTRTDMETQTALNSDAPKPSDCIPIERGYFRDGPEFDRVSSVLKKSKAHIHLDVHQGIEWYDDTAKKWIKLKTIEEVKTFLETIETKNWVHVSTGKSFWNKSDEYIAKINEYACGQRFASTVVTVGNAQRLVVSQVIHHKNVE